VLDGSGDLYFADTNNNRVRAAGPQWRGGVSPYAVPAGSSVRWRMPPASSSGPVAPGEAGLHLRERPWVRRPARRCCYQFLRVGGDPARGRGSPLRRRPGAAVSTRRPTRSTPRRRTPSPRTPRLMIVVLYQGVSDWHQRIGRRYRLPRQGFFATTRSIRTGRIIRPPIRHPRGTYLTIFCSTGEGVTNGPNVSGQPAAAPYPQADLARDRCVVSGISTQVAWYWQRTRPGWHACR
jgi:hypothetical protein